MRMHKHNTLTRAGAVLLAALLCFGLLAGCGKKDDGSGKVINYPVEAAPRRLDPAVARSPEELLVIANCMEGLVREDAEGRLAPGVAQRWEASADGRTWTFHLRGDNHWRLPEKAKELLGEEAFAAFDTQVTAEDFVFGLERARSFAGGYENILGVRAVDRRTLEITLSAPLAQTGERSGGAILHALARGAAMPCRRAYFEACGGRYGLEPKYLPCNGPFYLTRMDDVLTRLKPNGGYREGEQALPGTVNLWVEPDALLRAKLVGTEYDAAIVPGAMEREAPEEAGRTELRNAMLALVFNCEGTLGEANIRVALCAALEPQALGSGGTGLLPGGVRAGDGNYRALAGMPEGIKHDLARAVSLADAAKEKTALRLICAPAHETLLRRALQAWQRVFRLGLEAQVEILEPEDLEKRLEAGDFDVAVASLSIEHSSAPEALQALGGDGGGPARYRSPTLEALLLAAAQTDDVARACLQAEEHLLQNGVYYPLEAGSSWLLLAQGVEGLEVSPAGDLIFFRGVRKWEK